MGNKKALFAVGTTALTAFGTFVACGSDKAKPDAAVVHDSPVQHDAPADAAPDASPYDFTCFGGSAAGSATATITIAGTTESLGQGGASAVGSAAVAIYKTGVAAPVDTLTSGSDGTFTSAPIVTAGTPFDGYIKSAHLDYRVSYLYPPNPIAASLTGVPVAMISTASFAQLNTFLQQDDTANGALFLTVTDCNNMPLNGATLTATHGTVTDLGSLQSQLAGIFVVANVPDGSVDITASFGSMTFPTRTLLAHKEERVGTGSAAQTNGTLTITIVRPGP